MGVAVAIVVLGLIAIAADAHLVRQTLFERHMYTGNVLLVEPLDEKVSGETEEPDEDRGEGCEEERARDRLGMLVLVM